MKKIIVSILSYIIIFFNSNLSSNENNQVLKIGLLAPLTGEYKELGLENSNKYLFIKKVLGLNIDFEYGSIYNLSKFDNFDVTFCGSLLEHLRDPITAIEQLYFKTKCFGLK